MPYNGPALDPYTRLLASLADAVGNARRSMHSMTLLMIAASILFVAATLLFATSIVWVPATFALATAWVVSTCWALFFRSAGAAINYVNGVCAKIKAEVASHIEADNGLHQRTREAVTDHSFLRNIFDALPGVDSDLAFQRLSMFQLGSPTTPERDKEAANIHGVRAGSPRVARGNHGDDGDGGDQGDSLPAISPRQVFCSESDSGGR